MAKKKSKADDDGGVVVSGFGILTISVKLELHSDEPLFDVPTILQHRVQTVIPDPAVGKRWNPDRCLSAGYVLGAELARVANHLREGVADGNEIADGFAREMQDWDSDHGKAGE